MAHEGGRVLQQLDDDVMRADELTDVVIRHLHYGGNDRSRLRLGSPLAPGQSTQVVLH